MLQLVVPWSEAISDLVAHGWELVPDAIAPAFIKAVDGDERREWLLQSGNEGVVHQYAYTAYLPLFDVATSVRALGDGLVAGISDVARLRGLPSLPAFNEVTWSRYPARMGHITAHHDPPAYGGVTAIFTLHGHASFRVVDDDGTTQWETAPGQLVLLRGVDWPAPDSRCPDHEAGASQAGDRSIMTFRHKSGGAGAGYVV